MTSRNISGERFQLLTTFKAIFDQRSIVKAADTLGMTQSAASKQLQKLRYWFDDELFVRTAQGMEPTAKAVSIIEQVESILDDMEVLSAASHFNSATLQGSFVIATTDEVSQRLLPQLLAQLDEQAPKLRLTIIRLESDYSIRQLETGKVNLVITVNWHAPEQLIQQRLFCDQFVCLMSRAHPLAKKRLTIKNYADASHIMVAPLGKERGYIDDVLSRHGYKRFVRLSVPEFSRINHDLLGDQHLITLPHRVAKDLIKTNPLIIKKLPFDLPDIDYYLFWHRRFTHENTNHWMRNLINDVLGA